MAKRSRKNGGGSTAKTNAKASANGKAVGVRVPRGAPTQTSGSGFHEPKRYGKSERRSAKAEIPLDLG